MNPKIPIHDRILIGPNHEIFVQVTISGCEFMYATAMSHSEVSSPQPSPCLLTLKVFLPPLL